MEAEILKPNLAGMPSDGEAGGARLPRRCGRGQQIPFWHCLCGPAPGVLRPAHHMQRYTSSCGRAPDCRASTAICSRPGTFRSWGCAISGLLRRPCRHPAGWPCCCPCSVLDAGIRRAASPSETFVQWATSPGQLDDCTHRIIRQPASSCEHSQ